MIIPRVKVAGLAVHMKKHQGAALPQKIQFSVCKHAKKVSTGKSQLTCVTHVVSVVAKI